MCARDLFRKPDAALHSALPFTVVEHAAALAIALKLATDRSS